MMLPSGTQLRWRVWCNDASFRYTTKMEGLVERLLDTEQTEASQSKMLRSHPFFFNGAKSGFEMCFDIGSRHLGCWGQNTSRIQNKEVYTTLYLQANMSGWQSVSCFGAPTKHMAIKLIIICALYLQASSFERPPSQYVIPEFEQVCPPPPPPHPEGYPSLAPPCSVQAV